MIIRILGEGQYRVSPAAVAELNVLDGRLQATVDNHDADGFAAALGELLAAVRDHGEVVPDDELIASDLVLPAADADLGEVAALLGDDGLIPG